MKEIYKRARVVGKGHTTYWDTIRASFFRKVLRFLYLLTPLNIIWIHRQLRLEKYRLSFPKFLHLCAIDFCENVVMAFAIAKASVEKPTK
jgi:hypothetical protein